MGLLEGIIITNCGIKFTHTFAVVDFGRKMAYDLILGKRFMRQSKLIQDWGKNHLYLKHTHALIRVNIADCSYKDVKETPIDEHDSITTHRSRVLAWEQAQAHLWMCGAFDQGSLDVNHCIHHRSMDDKEYVPEPFSEDLFEPLEWTHVLATLDVCTNKITQTQ